MWQQTAGAEWKQGVDTSLPQSLPLPVVYPCMLHLSYYLIGPWSKEFSDLGANDESASQVAVENLSRREVGRNVGVLVQGLIRRAWNARPSGWHWWLLAMGSHCRCPSRDVALLWEELPSAQQDHMQPHVLLLNPDGL